MLQFSKKKRMLFNPICQNFRWSHYSKQFDRKVHSLIYIQRNHLGRYYSIKHWQLKYCNICFYRITPQLISIFYIRKHMTHNFGGRWWAGIIAIQFLLDIFVYYPLLEVSQHDVTISHIAILRYCLYYYFLRSPGHVTCTCLCVRSVSGWAGADKGTEM